MITIRKNSTDVTIDVYGVDDVSGLPKTGLAAGSITASYHRTRGARQSIAVTVISPTSAHTDGGWAEVDGVNEMGVYRFDVPDAVLAAGAEFVVVTLQAAGALIAPVRIQLVDATAGDISEEVHLCKAALVNRRVHTVSTGVDEIRDDDGDTTLVTMTPLDGGEDVIVVEPS